MRSGVSRRVRRRSNKFGAIPTVVEGERFPSRREARRFQELSLLQKAGAIQRLMLHPRFPIVVQGEKIADYLADFQYFDVATRRWVTEDVKSPPTRTPVYRLKKKLVEVLHGIRIVEVS